MKFAITGGTGFVGRTLARELIRDGHSVVLVSRGADRRDPEIFSLANARLALVGLDDRGALRDAFAGCDGVAHCAGINREMGAQTYERVHVRGTENVVAAAREAGVKRLALLSFLRARPHCDSPYHESKWAAEEIVRASGLDATVLKAGVIYGRGDHMLDHLSHAFHTFPLFALVGFKSQPVRPVAVADVVRVLKAALVDGRLAGKTVAVTGPEEMTLAAAVARVAEAVGKKPFFFRAPLAFHYALAWACERTMAIPLISWAQTRILSEGVVEPLPFAEELPADLRPIQAFTAEAICAGLPPPGRFGRRDFRIHRVG
jgi:NADH dehydrogenase